MAGPLEGFRILDLTAYVSGPLGTMILADQGADVIKVEPPGRGDLLRYAATQRNGISAYFVSCNRSKRSVALDLGTEAGRTAAQQLAKGVDAVVQNFRPGVVERLGMDYATLSADNPDLVYLSIYGLSDEGELAKQRVFDQIIQGMAGYGSVQADPETGEPALMRTAICDKITSLTAAQALTAAFLARAKGAGGQHVRVPMLDACLQFIWPDTMTNHTIQEPDVEPRPDVSEVFMVGRTQDGYVTLYPVTDQQYLAAFEAVGRADLLQDARFATSRDRGRNNLELLKAIHASVAGFTTKEILHRCNQADIPAGPVVERADLTSQSYIQETGVLLQQQHPQIGRYVQPRPPADFSATPTKPGRVAPMVGEHTREVLLEAGIEGEQLAQLCAAADSGVK
ncbi:MAG: CoA transferase [Pseudomonadales bacterium]|nr:CoA transferase [Pseudomonadales bacterium]